MLISVANTTLLLLCFLICLPKVAVALYKVLSNDCFVSSVFTASGSLQGLQSVEHVSFNYCLGRIAIRKPYPIKSLSMQVYQTLLLLYVWGFGSETCTCTHDCASMSPWCQMYTNGNNVSQYSSQSQSCNKTLWFPTPIRGFRIIKHLHIHRLLL